MYHIISQGVATPRVTDYKSFFSFSTTQSLCSFFCFIFHCSTAASPQHVRSRSLSSAIDCTLREILVVSTYCFGPSEAKRHPLSLTKTNPRSLVPFVSSPSVLLVIIREGKNVYKSHFRRCSCFPCFSNQQCLSCSRLPKNICCGE